VTTLYGIKVPGGRSQICRYDDGSGDELSVPLGTTAFVSGKIMFDILPKELKSLAVRSKVKYAPHPYVWMAPARALSTGLGIESEGLELPLSELPPWEESRIKIFPVVSETLSYAFKETSDSDDIVVVAVEESCHAGLTL
jgi:xanthine dioxygenase